MEFIKTKLRKIIRDCFEETDVVLPVGPWVRNSDAAPLLHSQYYNYWCVMQLHKDMTDDEAAFMDSFDSDEFDGSVYIDLMDLGSGKYIVSLRDVQVEGGLELCDVDYFNKTYDLSSVVIVEHDYRGSILEVSRPRFENAVDINNLVGTVISFFTIARELNPNALYNVSVNIEGRSAITEYERLLTHAILFGDAARDFWDTCVELLNEFIVWKPTITPEVLKERHRALTLKHSLKTVPERYLNMLKNPQI